MDDFLSFCMTPAQNSEKTLVQIKEKWRSFIRQIQSPRKTTTTRPKGTGTFEFYDDIDEFLSGSDKVNPKFVKETRVKPNVSRTNSDSGNSDELAAADPTTVADMRYVSEYCQVKS